MHLLSIATANPSARYTQEECLEVFKRSEARKRMKNRSVMLMEKILNRNNGITTRYFCYPDIETIFDAGPEKLNKVFEATAPSLGSDALNKALERARLNPDELDALIVCTCTGYLCPGLSSFVAEKSGLRPDCDLMDLVGMGCGAAIPSLRQAHHQIAANPDRKVAVLAVEICSAAFYLNDDPGVIISACLFGDGAAATIWEGGDEPAGKWTARDFDSLHFPQNRQLLRFENANGYLRNRLSKRVPMEAAKAVRELFERATARGMRPDSASILPHTGGRDVLDQLMETFNGVGFPDSRKILQDHGNMSSPSILYVLERHLQQNPQDSTDLWLTSFGAGFTAYAFQLSRQETGEFKTLG